MIVDSIRLLGHEVDIKYANEIQPGDYDIVHVHMANLANLLHERGIPYIYQLHDHHAYYYGKNSFVFNENLKAIENSQVSLMPGRFLVPYFETPKAIYFSHGVNTDFFKPTQNKPKEHRLLCLANNGLAGDNTFDRKGFKYGVGLAMLNNLPITIAGPSNNKEFFNANLKYELDTVTELHDASPNYYSDDGEILEIKAEFPYITDPYIASNMAKAILQRSRKQTSIQFLGTPEMYKLNIGDIVDITYSGLDLSTANSNNVFRIEALELQPNGLVSVSAIEYFDIYSWEVPTTETTADPVNLPTAGALQEPQNVSFTDTDASAIGRPILSWDNPTTYPAKEFRVDITDSSSNQVMSKIVESNRK